MKKIKLLFYAFTLVAVTITIQSQLTSSYPTPSETNSLIEKGKLPSCAKTILKITNDYESDGFKATGFSRGPAHETFIFTKGTEAKLFTIVDAGKYLAVEVAYLSHLTTCFSKAHQGVVHLLLEVRHNFKAPTTEKKFQPDTTKPMTDS